MSWTQAFSAAYGRWCGGSNGGTRDCCGGSPCPACFPNADGAVPSQECLDACPPVDVLDAACSQHDVCLNWPSVKRNMPNTSCDARANNFCGCDAALVRSLLDIDELRDLDFNFGYSTAFRRSALRAFRQRLMCWSIEQRSGAYSCTFNVGDASMWHASVNDTASRSVPLSQAIDPRYVRAYYALYAVTIFVAAACVFTPVHQFSSTRAARIVLFVLTVVNALALFGGLMELVVDIASGYVALSLWRFLLFVFIVPASIASGGYCALVADAKPWAAIAFTLSSSTVAAVAFGPVAVYDIASRVSFPSANNASILFLICAIAAIAACRCAQTDIPRWPRLSVVLAIVDAAIAILFGVVGGSERVSQSALLDGGLVIFPFMTSVVSVASVAWACVAADVAVDARSAVLWQILTSTVTLDARRDIMKPAVESAVAVVLSMIVFVVTWGAAVAQSARAEKPVEENAPRAPSEEAPPPTVTATAFDRIVL